MDQDDEMESDAHFGRIHMRRRHRQSDRQDRTRVCGNMFDCRFIPGTDFGAFNVADIFICGDADCWMSFFWKERG